MLRVLSLLGIAFMVLIFIFSVITLGYHQRIKSNKDEVQKNELTLLSLQKLTIQTDKQANSDEIDVDIFQNKVFSGYEEVVPFISYLEKLFFLVDPFAQVSIKSDESQIFLDHFADYQISLKIADKKGFFEALNKIYDSRFIVQVLAFTMNYTNGGDEIGNNLEEAELTIRLHLK